MPLIATRSNVRWLGNSSFRLIVLPDNDFPVKFGNMAESCKHTDCCNNTAIKGKWLANQEKFAQKLEGLILSFHWMELVVFLFATGSLIWVWKILFMTLLFQVGSKWKIANSRHTHPDYFNHLHPLYCECWKFWYFGDLCDILTYGWREQFHKEKWHEVERDDKMESDKEILEEAAQGIYWSWGVINKVPVRPIMYSFIALKQMSSIFESLHSRK